MCHVKLSRGKALEKFVAQWSATNVFSGKVCKKAESYCAVGRPTSLQTFSPPYIIMLYTKLFPSRVPHYNLYNVCIRGKHFLNSCKWLKNLIKTCQNQFSGSSLTLLSLSRNHNITWHTLKEMCIPPYTCSNEFAAAWMNLGIVQAALNKTQVS